MPVPHIIVEYSANVATDVDLSAFCEVLRKTASAIDALPMPGIRVRALQADHYAIADGNPAHGFIDITLRLRAGRSLDVRKHALRAVFESAHRYLEPIMAVRSLALSMEIRDIYPDLSLKVGTIRDHLKET